MSRGKLKKYKQSKVMKLYRLCHKRAGSLFDSKILLLVVLALFIGQAIWIAVSFRYPMVYDESFHLPIVQIYSQQYSPFIVDQPHKYDYLRDLTNETSYLYHYLMSMPYRLLAKLTDNTSFIIIALRFCNILFVAGGLFVYWKVFKTMGIRSRYSTVGIFLFTLIPLVPFVAAQINYDNLLFLLTALYVYLGVKLIQSRNIQLTTTLVFVAVGCLACLIKFTFLPVYAVTLLLYAAVVFKRNRNKTWYRLRESYNNADRRWLLATLIGLAVVVGLFCAIYIKNFLVYGSPAPRCIETMDRERCLKSGIVKRDLLARATRDERPAAPLAAYWQSWFNNMTLGSIATAQNVRPNDRLVMARPLTTMYNMIQIGTVIALGVLALAWFRIKHLPGINMITLVVLVVVLSVLYVNTKGYYASHIANANQPRYILSVIPMVVILATYGFASLTRRLDWIVKIGLLSAVVILMAQGGGFTTHVLRSEDNWYWDNEIIIEANNSLKTILSKVISE